MMKRGKPFLFGAIILGWVFTLGTFNLQAARTEQVEKDLTQKKKDLKDVKKELSLTKEKEKKIRGEETSVLGSLNRIEADLYKKEKELKKMEVQLGKTKERLHQTKDQVTALNRGMERSKAELFYRLTALYKMGRVPLENFLMTSQSYLDLLKMDKYFRVVINSDTQLIDTYRHQMALKEKYQKELTEDELLWERNISGVEEKKEEIQKIRESKRALLKTIQNQKVVYQKLIGELEDRAKELQVLVDKLERERTAVVSYGKSRHDAFKGKLPPPLEGKVISLFKERGQNGIEIKAPVGAEIRAVLPGRVLYADWFKGFGNIIIIDHGDQVFTVSGYCSELLKKEGATVSQGESIALVGSSGSLKGPSLYFEIRHQGKPQNPMNWISQTDKMVSLPETKEQGRK